MFHYLPHFLNKFTFVILTEQWRGPNEEGLSKREGGDHPGHVIGPSSDHKPFALTFISMVSSSVQSV